MAPEAMMELEVPTHAFIGGSSGNMDAIIKLLLEKNPEVRIVINCITLETVTEAMEAIRKFDLEDVDIVQLGVARSKSVGRYHMMMGENPIYIISCNWKRGGTKVKIPRVLLAAGASGSGKTLITCGLLQALVNRNLKTASFKCGPDYIDPMFHSRVIGTKSRNLDTFFTDENRTRYLLAKNAADCEIAVMEGVMGYYDGVGGTTSRASAYDLAKTTDTPVILIVNSRGMSVSLAAYVKGFLEYKKDSHICGVIFNQMSPMLYPRMKQLLEEELSVKVLGYVPKVEDCVIESRHLGLVLPEEIPELKNRLQKLAEVLEKTLDIDGILELAQTAPELQAPDLKKLIQEDAAFAYHTEEKVRIGVADDEAFCFFMRII